MRHDAAGQLSIGGPRVERVESGVDEAIESHGGAARGHHGDENPSDRRPRERNLASRKERARQRKRQREHRVAETDK
ncbi:hypothetical protein D3C83_83810 [compost metagenome]